VRCRLRDSNRLLSVLDLGATPPCEKFLTADELDSPEPTFPLHLLFPIAILHAADVPESRSQRSQTA
jgi:hypothetical protein